MKFIALKDFAKVTGMDEIKVEKQLHPRHIHEGAIFTLGTSDTLEQMQDVEPAKALLAAQLVHAGCIGDATKEDITKKVAKSLAERKSREETAAKYDAASTNQGLIDAMTAAFAKLVPQPK